MKFQARTNEQRKLEVNWSLVDEYCQRWKPHTYLTLKITRKKSPASDPFRGYYFGTVLPTFSRKLGYEPEEDMQFHDFLKSIFFKIKPDVRGVFKGLPSVFSKNPTVTPEQRVEYLEWVKRKAAKYGVYIPDSGE